jgi:hypothetical protein
MDALGRRRPVFSIVPLLFGLLVAQRAAANVRAVDFVTIFAGGVLLGVGLVGLVSGLREKR